MSTYKKISNLTTSELKDKIKNTKSFASLVKAIYESEEILSKVNKLTNPAFKNKGLLEKLYSIKLNLTEYPKCKICSSDAKLASKNWSDYCEGVCGYMDRWNNMSDNEKNRIFNKLSKTYYNKTKYEIESIKNKRKTTLNKRYGVDHNFNIPEVIENRKNTWIDKYGYDNPNKSQEVKDRIISTNNERYGHNSPLLNEDIKKKANETLYKNHKVDHNMKAEISKESFKDTCNKKYNCDHYMQNAEIFERITKKNYSYKTIKLNGKTYKVQGYENVAIEYLLKTYSFKEESFIISDNDISNITGAIMWTDFNGISHRYYPDFYLTENHTLYEVKSEYTYKTAKEDGSLDKKIEACEHLGLDIIVLVFNKKKQLIYKYERNKN